MKLLLYCTKAKPYIMKYKDGKYKEIASFYNKQDLATYDLLNGKIVAECDFEVEEIRPEKYWHSTEDFDYIYNTGTVYYDDLLKKSCLMDYELDDYLGCEDNGYAIHIKNLHIFDEPRKLYDCLIHPKIEPKYYGCEHLGKAPQNMMYVELDDIRHILISIRPQWLCKILNGEKTIEVRKKVLKEMIK